MAKFSIATILEKIGVKNESELTPDELQTVERWKAILSEGEITVDKIKEFCLQQIKLIEGKFANDPLNINDTYNKALLHVYLNIVRLIEAPQAEKERLEKHLEDLIK